MKKNKNIKNIKIAGFYNRKGFIISQHPLESTVSALWQLVAEQDVQVQIFPQFFLSYILFLKYFCFLFFKCFLFLSGDCSAVEPGQPGLPGLLANLGLDADHVGRGLQPVHRHHHLPGWILAKVISDYTDGDVHVAAVDDDDEMLKLISQWNWHFLRTIKLRLESGTMSKEVFATKFSWHWNWT